MLHAQNGYSHMHRSRIATGVHRCLNCKHSCINNVSICLRICECTFLWLHHSIKLISVWEGYHFFFPDCLFLPMNFLICFWRHFSFSCGCLQKFSGGRRLSNFSFLNWQIRKLRHLKIQPITLGFLMLGFTSLSKIDLTNLKLLMYQLKNMILYFLPHTEEIKNNIFQLIHKQLLIMSKRVLLLKKKQKTKLALQHSTLASSVYIITMALEKTSLVTSGMIHTPLYSVESLTFSFRGLLIRVWPMNKYWSYNYSITNVGCSSEFSGRTFAALPYLLRGLASLSSLLYF